MLLFNKYLRYSFSSMQIDASNAIFDWLAPSDQSISLIQIETIWKLL